MNTITWLHFSDLHFQHQDQFNRDVVLDALWGDIRRRTSKISSELEHIDFIVVTGDIAYHGEEQEFRLAYQEFFKPLHEIVDSDVPVFVVPGNHDICRDSVTMGAKMIGNSLQTTDHINALLATPRDRDVVFARLQNYLNFFAEEFPWLKVDETGEFYVGNCVAGGRKVAILGLNSAWLCYGGDEDKGRLCIGEQQVDRALAHAKDAEIIIALFHHPFGWYRDNDDTQAVEFLLRSKCHFILHGHLHRPNIRQESTLEGDTIIIPAGAIYDSRKSPNSYNYAHIDLETGEGTIYLRRYSNDRREWLRDIQSTGEERDGRLDFKLPVLTRGGVATSIVPSHAIARESEEAAKSSWVPAVIGDSRHGFFGEVVRGIEDTLATFSIGGAPLSAIVCNHDDRNWVEESYLRTFLKKPVCGLIIAPSSSQVADTSLLKSFVGRGIPVVQVDRRIKDLRCPWVGIDNFAAGYAATSHLLKHGYKRIAIIGGRAEVSTNRERFQGYSKALEEAGCKLERELIVWGCSEWDPSRTATKILMSSKDPPRALFCLSGMATLGSVLALKELGLKCPEQVAIVGFDDNPWALLNDPPISVIRQPAWLIGQKAAALVWEAIQGQPVSSENLLSWELVIRRSCGC